MPQVRSLYGSAHDVRRIVRSQPPISLDLPLLLDAPTRVFIFFTLSCVVYPGSGRKLVAQRMYYVTTEYNVAMLVDSLTFQQGIRARKSLFPAKPASQAL